MSRTCKQNGDQSASTFFHWHFRRPISFVVFCSTIQKFQRLAKLYSFEWLPFSKKVESFINATFLVNTLIQKMSNFFKRPIQSKFSSQPAPANKAKTAPSM